MQLLKKSILFLTFLLPLSIHAQTYHSFPDSLGRWVETEIIYHDCTYPNQYTEYDYIYGQAGDTSINGLKYSLIGFQTNRVFFNNQIGVSSCDSIDFHDALIGAIREDSLHKIWFRHFNFNTGFRAFQNDSIDTIYNKDILLYDFGMTPGILFG